jgi:hypothetical protein
VSEGSTPVRHANEFPAQIQTLNVQLKAEKASFVGRRSNDIDRGDFGEPSRMLPARPDQGNMPQNSMATTA